MTTLSHRTIKNSVYSFIGFIWPLLLTFISTPLLIKGLGSAKYGYYILLNVSISFLLLLDFGLSYTFIKKLSENPQAAASDEIKKIFSTTFFSYLFIGLVVLLLLVFSPDIFKNLFKINDSYVFSHQLIFIFLGLNFLFKMITITIGQIPYALQRSDITTKISLTSVTFTQAASIIAVLLGLGITTLISIQLLSSILIFILCFVINRRLLPELKIIPVFSLSFFKKIIKDGFWIFITNGASNVLSQLDKLVVGIFSGSTAVTYYASSQMIPEKINSTAFSLSVSFFPVFSQSSVSGDKESTKKIFRRGLAMITFIAGGLAVPVVIYKYQLLYYWLGAEIANNAYQTVNFLAATYFLIALAGFYDFFLSGWGRLKFITFISVFTALLDVLFMFILIPDFGIVGAAAAYLISVLPTPFIILYIEKKYLNSSFLEAARYYLNRFFRVLLIATIIYFFSIKLLAPYAKNLIQAIFLGAISLFLYGALYWLAGFIEKEDKNLLKSFLKNYLIKFNLIKPTI
jgi:O-antigen/teichoic acid export membrane protein